jgi:hypothetical protein
MSKIIKTYNQLPPNVKQSINNVAAKAATSAVKQVQNSINRNRQSKTRSKTTRTRNGMRIYSPNDVVESKAVAPVSYATTWTSGNRSLRVHQTEVIGKVSANSTWFPSWNDKYSVATFPINPANPRTFPWLSYIARLYDKYRFYGLKFMFVNAVSTQTEGNLMMSLDYDTLDKAPANLVQASQLAKYKVSPLYCPCEFVVPVSHPGNSNWLYTFDLSATTNTVDLKTYNLGNFFLSLDGVPQDGKDYGYLAVEYDVELLDKNPVIDNFASKTWDSSAPVAKKARSNVDPADTMVVTSKLDQVDSEEVSEAMQDKLTLKCDADVGAKVRAMVFLTLPSRVRYWSTETTGTTLDATIVTDSASGTSGVVLNVEGTVGSDGVFYVGLSNSWEPEASDVSPAVSSAMAYTYA